MGCNEQKEQVQKKGRSWGERDLCCELRFASCGGSASCDYIEQMIFAHISLDEVKLMCSLLKLLLTCMLR